MMNTIIPKICDGVNFLFHNPSQFYHKNGERHVSFDGIDPYAMDDGKCFVTVQHNVFLAGDLAYLAVIMGKEGNEKDWCYICDLCKIEWASFNHTPGNHWTVDSIKTKHALNVQNDSKGTDRTGVKCNPYFDIPVENVLFSVLHALIGIGNNILVYLIDSIEENIDNLPQEEIGLQNEIHLIELNLDRARNQRNAWDAHHDKGKMRSKIKALKGRLKKKLEHSGLSLIQVQELTENIECIQPQIDLLDAGC